MRQGPESRADVEESPIPVEFLNDIFRRFCSVWSGVIMLKNHSLSSTQGAFAGFLPPDGKVVGSSVQQRRSSSSQAVHNG
jgi:hypothetical protein